MAAEARLFVQVLHSKDVLCSTGCYNRGPLQQQPVPGSCTKRSHSLREASAAACVGVAGVGNLYGSFCSLKYISAVLSLLPAPAGTGPGN